MLAASMRRLLSVTLALLTGTGCLITRFPQNVAQSFRDDDMQKMSTANAEIYYPAKSRAAALHVARRLEQCVEILRGNTQSGTPREKMHVMITGANFNNANVAPKVLGMEQRMLLPVQMSSEFFPLIGIGSNEIGDVACHEAVHYVHLEETNGFWRIVNVALGNIHQPNMFADTWFLEGLATYYEANLKKRTGRPANPLWRALFESGVAKDPIDSGDLSPHNRTQYPVGAHYLVGQHFVEYLAHKHGEQKLWEFVDVQGGAIFSPLWVTLRFKSVFGNSIGAEMDLYSEHLRRTVKLRERKAEQQVLVDRVGLGGRLSVARTGEYALWSASRDEVNTLRIYEPDGRLRVIKRMTQIFPGRDWIASSPLSASGLSFTADGKELAFVLSDVTVEGSEHSRVIVLDAQTGDLKRTSPPFLGLGGQISADGVSFLVVELHDQQSDLARLDIATGKLERLTALEGFESIESPAWSPDGSRIAFSRWSGDGFHLFVREANGTLRPVVTDGAYNYGARWIDAERVLFMRSEDFRAQPHIAHVSTGAIERAFEVPYIALDPHPTPDGRMIFINRDGWDFSLDSAPLKAQLAMAQANGAGQTTATDATLTTRASDDLPPRTDSLPDLGIERDEPYRQTDNLLYPGFRLPFVAPIARTDGAGNLQWGVFAFASALGADRLGLHMWALQVQYDSFSGPPQLSGAYGTYLTAPWLTSLSGSYANINGTLQANASVAAARSFYTWPVALSFDYLHQQPVDIEGGPSYAARFIGPTASISWSGVDSTVYAGGQRGLALGSSVSYYPRGFGSSQNLSDLRATATAFIPLPLSRRHSFSITGVGRVVPSENGSFLRVGGQGALGFLSRDVQTGALPIGSHPSRQFSEALAGYEDREFRGDSALLSTASYRYTFVIDEGWASFLYLFPPYFIREIDLGLFGSMGRINPDRSGGPQSVTAAMLGAAGGSLAYRAAIGTVPISLVYQYAYRFDHDLGSLHMFAIEIN